MLQGQFLTTRGLKGRLLCLRALCSQCRNYLKAKWFKAEHLSIMTVGCSNREPVEVCATSMQTVIQKLKYAHAVKTDSSVSQLVETAGV